MLIEAFGFQAAIRVFGAMATASPKAVDAAVRDEAFYLQRLIVKQFRTQGDGKWKPINPITRALRRGASQIGRPSSKGTKALVGTGGMRKSVQAHREGFAKYFVGVHRTAGKPPGSKKGYTDIAAIHETGVTVIPITEKMRRFFMWLFWKGIIPYPWPPANKRYILIPRRSFVEQAMKEFAPGHKERMLRRYAAHLSGRGAIKL